MPNIVARMAFICDLHDRAHGCKARPFPQKRRWDWDTVARYWGCRAQLQWTQIREIADELGRDPNRPRDDRELLEAMSRKLRALAETRPRLSPESIRRRAAVRNAKAIARLGICPSCGGKLPCTACNIAG